MIRKYVNKTVLEARVGRNMTNKGVLISYFKAGFLKEVSSKQSIKSMFPPDCQLPGSSFCRKEKKENNKHDFMT